MYYNYYVVQNTTEKKICHRWVSLSLKEGFFLKLVMSAKKMVSTSRKPPHFFSGHWTLSFTEIMNLLLSTLCMNQQSVLLQLLSI